MTLLGNISPEWLEAQYQLWQQHPEQLTAQWRAFFEGFALGEETPAATQAPIDAKAALKQSAVQSLIYRYRSLGHLLACTDPLSPCPLRHPLLDLEAFGLDEGDLERTFHTRRFPKESAPLREIVTTLRETYCTAVGVEFMHIQDPEERQWLIERMETVRNRPRFEHPQQLAILRKLQEAALFEAFLHKRFVGQKRFSLEGGEVLIPVLDSIVQKAAAAGTSDLVLGMSHRGRLNVLANIFAKPLENIFAEFQDNLEHGFVGEGDVKYHLGFSRDLTLPGGRTLHLTLAPNPSHLEAVNPVVEGKCRARQDGYGREGARKVQPVLLHGDAAFAGQGLVAETFNLSQLEGYATGGTLHIVLNNQIGFTTPPESARSTLYATDVAKMLSVPIFHVHGEDPEAAIHAATLALDYRHRYGRDVVLEIICYRKHGHNEGDEPFFTQPLMYERIRQRPPAHAIYAERLQQQGVAQQEIEAQQQEISARLEAAYEQKPQLLAQAFGGKWQAIRGEFAPRPVATGVAREVLQKLGETLSTIPEGFTPHPKVADLLQRRGEAIAAGGGIDWGTGEALAFATLLAEGTTVRLSGQDSRRGTFNHRHSTLVDVRTGKSFVPLAAVAPGTASFRAYDSMLSEAAVLGFEYGYALETPLGLTLWEAQFGDFANGAQVIIDQFVASGHTKWQRSNGLVMLLPHGYEGQGAEHSSARIERYLQLCADHNLVVANPTTPAQLFHLLRRQVRQSFRRPLIVFTPKSLLRHPRCTSELTEFTDGSFAEVLPDPAAPDSVRTVLLCSGKVYYDLRQRAEEQGHRDAAIVRIEQLYPLAGEQLAAALAPFGKDCPIAWVQEEPANAGAWPHLRTSLREILGREPEYIGRDAAAAPAVGSHRRHGEEQQELLERALPTPGQAT